MSGANVELNFLVSDLRAVELRPMIQGEVTLLVTDDARNFEFQASKDVASFIFVDANWENNKESLRSTLGKFATKPNAVIFAEDLSLGHFLGLMGVPGIVTVATLQDLIGTGSFTEKFCDKVIPRLVHEHPADAESSQHPDKTPEKRLVFGDPKSRAV